MTVPWVTCAATVGSVRPFAAVTTNDRHSFSSTLSLTNDPTGRGGRDDTGIEMKAV